MPTTRDLNVLDFAPLPPPGQIVRRLPLTDTVAQHVLAARAAIGRILNGEDQRLLISVAAAHYRRAVLDPRSGCGA
jgi:phospho-2-dehydro-3-deoxyheptonate aldolase